MVTADSVFAVGARTVTKPSDFDLDADEIVTAAVEIFQESGLDAVSMRSVSLRLGVSPVPLYSRIGNKDALLDAIADRLLADLAPPSNENERWDEYGLRWVRELRSRLRRARDSRLILWPERDAYMEASRPLVDAMLRGGFPADAAVQACRLLTWATVGFVAVECGVEPPANRRRRRRGRPGGDPGGVDPAEVDTLFDLHIRYVIDGITRDAEHDVDRPPTPRKRRGR
jgi:TetR/AcrR family tetracycline transcriptional repressor